MAVPDKIYLQTAGITNGFVGLAWIDKNFNGEPIEYIRKDALLELLEAEKKRHSDRHSIEGISACHALRELIEKLESL